MANTPIHPVRIPDPEWEALARLGARDDRSRAYWINKFIRDGLAAQGIEVERQD